MFQSKQVFPDPSPQNCQMEQPMIHSWQEAQSYHTKDPVWFKYKEKKKNEEKKPFISLPCWVNPPANLSDQKMSCFALCFPALR